MSRAQYLQMVGRAGRAGHATRGESFLMGKGPPEAAGGGSEWEAVCGLLHQPLPDLDSRLLPAEQLRAAPVAKAPAAARAGNAQPAQSASAASCPGAGTAAETEAGSGRDGAKTGGSAPARAGGNARDGERETAHLQRLLLEAIANGAAAGHADIERLLSCTLLWHQASDCRLYSHTMWKAA